MNYKEEIINALANVCKRARKEGYEEADSNQRENAVYEYEQGLNDAWECTRKIACTPEKGGYTWSALEQIFNTRSLSDIINTYTASEAIAKIKEYEEQTDNNNDEIKVGDELIDIDTDSKVVVVDIRYKSPLLVNFRLMYDDGSTEISNKKEVSTDYRKTGKNYPQIAEVLKQMKEGNE